MHQKGMRDQTFTGDYFENLQSRTRNMYNDALLLFEKPKLKRKTFKISQSTFFESNAFQYEQSVQFIVITNWNFSSDLTR